MARSFIFKCCICGKQSKGWGNNPDGAMWIDDNGKYVTPKFKDNDRCCNDCDNRYVIPGRLYRYALSKKKGE